MVNWQDVKEASVLFWTVFFLGFILGLIVGMWL